MEGMSANLMVSIVPLLVIIPFIALFIYCLVDVLKSEFTGTNKIVWLLAVFFLPLLGSILYLFIGRKQKI